mmetsp:Transcript_16122/g.51706  ORF Transcript_16122/g.51706 Transcript_16122/m.51706 type:complete len:407 (-) Transcript_16122:269-1489(-)
MRMPDRPMRGSGAVGTCRGLGSRSGLLWLLSACAAAPALNRLLDGRWSFASLSPTVAVLHKLVGAVPTASLQQEVPSLAKEGASPFAEYGDLSELFEWAHANGAKGLENVRPESFDKSGHLVRGLASARDVRMGERLPLLAFPTALVIHAAHPLFLASPAVAATLWPGSVLHRYYFPLVLYLAIERRLLENGGRSFWAPYTRTLRSPEEFAAFHPNYASVELLRNFSDLSMACTARYWVEHLEKRWQESGKDWSALARKAGARGLSFEDFRWAVTVFQSRCFTVNWAEGSVLKPLFDLANTGPAKNADWKRDLADDGSQQWWVTERVKKGSEVLIEYGQHSNDVMLYGYGFLMVDNPVPATRLAPALVQRLQDGPLHLDVRDAAQPGILRSLLDLTCEQCGLPAQS